MGAGARGEVDERAKEVCVGGGREGGTGGGGGGLCITLSHQ